MILSITAGMGTTTFAKEVTVTSISASNLPKKKYSDLSVDPVGIKITVQYSDKTSQTVTITDKAKWHIGGTSWDAYVYAKIKLKKSNFTLKVQLPDGLGFGGFTSKDDGKTWYDESPMVVKVYDKTKKKYVKSKSYKFDVYSKNKSTVDIIKKITYYNNSRYRNNTYLLITYTNGKQELVSKSKLAVADVGKAYVTYFNGKFSEGHECRYYVYKTQYGFFIDSAYITFKNDKGFTKTAEIYSDENEQDLMGSYSKSAKVKSLDKRDDYKYVSIKGTTLSKVTAKSKGFTAKWTKQTKNTSGYQIQYATDSKFTKNKKTVTVSKNSTTSKTISKLNSKKKYYVRIRTYKNVKVNGKNTKIYSSWSKAKTVTTKK